MRLCIIPARGGSKRIPRKNIKPFNGKPMIAWSIEAARASGLFDQVLVSTDDEEIATTAASHGAEIPFMRPPELADDQAGTGVVVTHAIRWHQANRGPASLVCCLYATAPFVRPDDLIAANRMREEAGAAFVFSAATFGFPILRAIGYDEAGRLGPLFPEHIGKRSQDLPEAYHDAGQFYLGSAQDWLDNLPMFGPRSRLFVLPRHRVQDIDTPEDWTRAEWLFRAMQAQQP